jgi:hypothetical protein
VPKRKTREGGFSLAAQREQEQGLKAPNFPAHFGTAEAVPLEFGHIALSWWHKAKQMEDAVGISGRS